MSSSNANPSILPPDLMDTVHQARASGMSDGDIVDSLSKHPVYGSRVQGILGDGATPSDIIGAITDGSEQSGQSLAPKPKWYQPGGTLEKVLTAPSDFVKAGLDQFDKGANEYFGTGPNQFPPGTSRGEQTAQGMSDMARGGGQAALPLVLPAMAAAPVASAVGAGTGMALGAGTEAGLRAAGVPEGYAQLGGTAVGLGSGAAAGYGATKIESPFKINPADAATRAWRPLPSDSDFPQVTPSAGSDVKTYGNPGVRTNADTIPAANDAIAHFQKGLNAYTTRAEMGGVQMEGDVLVQAAHDAIPDLMWTRDPQGAQAIVDNARQAFGGKYFNVSRWRDWLKTENASLSKFYALADARQVGASTAGTPPAIEEAQAQAMREALYRQLSPEDGGAGPREIQQRTSDIIGLRNAADRISNRVSGYALSDAERFGRAIPATVKRAITLDLPGAARQLRHPMSDPINTTIGQFYDAVPHADPIPVPMSAQHPFAQRLQLGSGAHQMAPSTPDASYVRSVPAMPQPPNPARALPAPDLVTPPPPDTSYVAGRQGMYPTGPNPARALPPSRTFIMPPADASGPHPSTSASPLVSPSGPSYGTPPTGDSIALRMGKEIWRALGGPQ